MAGDTKILASQPNTAERRLEALRIQLPSAPTPFGSYVETVQTGNLLFFSGMLPVVDHKPKYIGRIGKELDADQGRATPSAPPLSASSLPPKITSAPSTKSRASSRLSVFIATSGDFYDQPRVADAASDLFRDIFGADKLPVRTVIGVASLPLGVPVEVEVIFEVAA